MSSCCAVASLGPVAAMAVRFTALLFQQAARGELALTACMHCTQQFVEYTYYTCVRTHCMHISETGIAELASEVCVRLLHRDSLYTQHCISQESPWLRSYTSLREALNENVRPGSA